MALGLSGILMNRLNLKEISKTGKGMGLLTHGIKMERKGWKDIIKMEKKMVFFLPGIITGIKV